MERLRVSDPSGEIPLRPEQKQALAELDRLYRAKIAEREVFLEQTLREAREKGDGKAVQAIRQQLASERTRLEEERDEAKEKVRRQS